ncbi:protein FAR-RED-ELONGATED HYPOCOTYL 1-LIKE-like [Macadamia integrifolia]|uniref:protein FAR-RED-ELONGATED HYPOCOTYL 1-LIKE-like n=1 Tax=Macadamia integrifolia TaxID=60698 RepID=UPI001C52A405|nr:protein FAR-RED-ELONGATED HYPOCOTYL 1-LIKE-like [Macadamia integrifolia]
MDEHIGNSNKIIIHSFHDNKYEVIQAKVADLNKKRKLESQQLFFPLSKHKFGYRCSGFDHEQPLAEKSDENKVIHEQTNKGKRVVELADESSELESAKDSNSFVGGSDSPMSGNAETESMPEAEDFAQSITSSGSDSSNSLKDTLHSLHRRIIKEPTIGKEDQVLIAGIGKPNRPNDNGQLQFGPGAQFSADQLQQFEEHAYRISVPYQVDGLQKCMDEELEDIMLYSNGPSETDMFVLSSGRLSIDKEAQQGTRRPTIDQEFEKYFSSLML